MQLLTQYSQTTLCVSFTTFLSVFYRAMLRRVRYCYGKLSVRLSVTLKYRGHICWNYWKIISRFISPAFLLSADHNVTDLLQREHSQILAGIGVGCGKTGNITETVKDKEKVTINGL